MRGLSYGAAKVAVMGIAGDAALLAGIAAGLFVQLAQAAFTLIFPDVAISADRRR